MTGLRRLGNLAIVASSMREIVSSSHNCCPISLIAATKLGSRESCQGIGPGGVDFNTHTSTWTLRDAVQGVSKVYDWGEIEDENHFSKQWILQKICEQ